MDEEALDPPRASLRQSEEQALCDDEDTIGARIRTARLKLGLTQTQVMQQTGINLSRIEMSSSCDRDAGEVGGRAENDAVRWRGGVRSETKTGSRPGLSNYCAWDGPSVVALISQSLNRRNDITTSCSSPPSRPCSTR